jgi:hypothetical protein
MNHVAARQRSLLSNRIAVDGVAVDVVSHGEILKLDCDKNKMSKTPGENSGVAPLREPRFPVRGR